MINYRSLNISLNITIRKLLFSLLSLKSKRNSLKRANCYVVCIVV